MRSKSWGSGHAFCYVCETDWKLHSQDYFNCNKYTEVVKNKEKDANKIKMQIKRYEFYFSRYLDNKKAVEKVNKTVRDNLKEKIEDLNKLYNLSNLENQFILL